MINIIPINNQSPLNTSQAQFQLQLMIFESWSAKLIVENNEVEGGKGDFIKKDD